MTDDLVKRLRDSCVYNEQHYAPDPLVAEAADRIEALTAENKRLREAGTKLAGFAGHDELCAYQEHWWRKNRTCDCGYTDAWKAWSAALGDTQ